MHLREGKGTPKSQECLDAFMLGWISWAGWPEQVITDRGLHNRGVFAKTLGANGIAIRNTGVEAPEQLAAVERHGGLWKDLAKRTITSRKLEGEAHMRLLAPEVNAVKNESSRHGGFSPASWIL